MGRGVVAGSGGITDYCSGDRRVDIGDGGTGSVVDVAGS